jgi:hypothetical protein
VPDKLTVGMLTPVRNVHAGRPLLMLIILGYTVFVC